MKNNKSLIVIDMQDKFLGSESDHGEFYFEKRKKLIVSVRQRVIVGLEGGEFIINITFGDSPIVDELRDILLRDEVRQFVKKSDGLFYKSKFQSRLVGDSLERTLITSNKDEFNAVYPKKRTMGYPIKQLMLRGGGCELVGVSTTECVLAVNLDLRYLADRVQSKTRFKVMGSLCMTSHPQHEGAEISQEQINKAFAYHGLPHPLWDVYN